MNYILLSAFFGWHIDSTGKYSNIFKPTVDRFYAEFITIMLKYNNVDYLMMTCGLRRNRNTLMDIFYWKMRYWDEKDGDNFSTSLITQKTAVFI